jgi:hypothetical protein
LNGAYTEGGIERRKERGKSREGELERGRVSMVEKKQHIVSIII